MASGVWFFRVRKRIGSGADSAIQDVTESALDHLIETYYSSWENTVKDSRIYRSTGSRVFCLGKVEAIPSSQTSFSKRPRILLQNLMINSIFWIHDRSSRRSKERPPADFKGKIKLAQPPLRRRKSREGQAKEFPLFPTSDVVRYHVDQMKLGKRAGELELSLRVTESVFQDLRSNVPNEFQLHQCFQFSNRQTTNQHFRTLWIEHDFEAKFLEFCQSLVRFVG